MTPITADSWEGRVLLALRPGPMSPYEMDERWPSRTSGHALVKLIRARLVEKVGGDYRLTDAGRAACPLRNPLAAPGVVPPITVQPETDMARDNIITRQQVFAHIAAAGADGITRKNLIEHFAVPAANIDMHLTALRRLSPPAIFQPERGLIVAVEPALPARTVSDGPLGKATHATREVVLRYLEGRPAGTASTAGAISEATGCSEESTRAVLGGLFAGLKINREQVGDDFAYFVPPPTTEPAAVVERYELSVEHFVPPPATEPAAADTTVETIEITGVKQTTEAMIQADTPAPACVQEPAKNNTQTALTVASETQARPALPASIVVDNADDIEIWLSSDGSMRFVSEHLVVSLAKPATRKLREFLGLFQEAV